MFKKLVSAVCLWTILGSVMPLSAFAGNVQISGLIQSVTLTVASSTPQTFEPSAGQVLKTAVVFDTTNFATELSKSTGTVKVMQGTKVVKILTTWTDTTLPASIADWDGKAIENTAEAQGICGTLGAVCPVGDYQIAAHVQYTSGTNTFFDDKTAPFKIFVTPSVAISGLAISATTFNPLTATADISFTTSKDGFITVEVFDSTTLVRTLVANENLTAGAYSKTNKAALAWDGKDASGVVVANKTYTIKVTSRQTASGSVLDTKSINVDVNAPTTLSIISLTVTPTPVKTAGTFDPAPKGDNQDLIVAYQLNKAADSVSVDIKDSKNGVPKTLNNGSGASGSLQWNGEISSGVIAVPGVYTAVFTANKSGESPLIISKTFTVAYNNSQKGAITNLSVGPDSFDPNFDDTVIEFKNTVDAAITARIETSTGAVVRTFTGYNNQDRGANSANSIVWDGKDDSGNSVSLNTYKVVVITRNDYGAVTDSKDVTLNSSGGFISDSNDHISGISFSPSSTFKPGKDDQLEVEFDVKQKLSSLEVFAIRGSKKIPLYSQNDVNVENNIETTWDGTDTLGDYADAGSWRISFKSRIGSTTLNAFRTINVDYDQPKIQELQLSKSKFDNDKGEFTNLIFKVDKDSTVNVKVLSNGKEEEDVVTDMEVNSNEWYAVQWDGSGYNYNDNIDLRLIAANKANKNIFDSKKIKVDLAEDGQVSNRANITNDYLDPVLTDGSGNVTIHYSLDDYGDVKISILKSNSTSGSTVIELLDLSNQDPGDHEIIWNGKDENNKKLGTGFYTYKIVSTKTSSDTENGLFVIGNVGDSGSSSSNSSSSKTSIGKVNPNVIVDGKMQGQDDDKNVDNGNKISKPPVSQCAGFSDVKSDNEHCEAITWTKGAGIFSGYANGTFGINNPINRVELLKVISQSYFKPESPEPGSGNLGFKDVDVKEWYMQYIYTAKKKGIVSGDGGGKNTFRPNDFSQRVEALKMIFEGMKSVGLIGEIGTSCPASHNDVAAGTWYRKYVCEADKFELYDATIDNTFGTGVLSTRGEIAEVLYRLHLQNLF